MELKSVTATLFLAIFQSIFVAEARGPNQVSTPIILAYLCTSADYRAKYFSPFFGKAGNKQNFPPYLCKISNLKVETLEWLYELNCQL